MADEKKKSGAKKRAEEESEQSQKKKSASAGGSAAKKSGAGTKKTQAPRLEAPEEPTQTAVKVKKENDPSSATNQLVMILLAVVAFFIVICFLFKNDVGILGKIIAEGFFGLFGLGAILIPILLCQLAIFWKKDVASRAVKYKYIVSIFTLLAFSVIVHAIWSIAAKMPDYTFESAFAWERLKALFTNGVEHKGGGFLGGFFASALICVVGYPGTLIFGILLLIAFVLTLFGLTPSECVQRIRFYIRLSKNKRLADTAQKQAEQAESAHTERAKTEPRRKERKERPTPQEPEEEEIIFEAPPVAPKRTERPKKRAVIDSDIFAEDAEFGRAEKTVAEEVVTAKTRAKKVTADEPFVEKDEAEHSFLHGSIDKEDRFFNDEQGEMKAPAKGIGERKGARRIQTEDENIFDIPVRKEKAAHEETETPRKKPQTVLADKAAPKEHVISIAPVQKTEKIEKTEKTPVVTPILITEEEPPVQEDISILPPEPMVDAPETEGDDIPDEMPKPPKYEFPPLSLLKEPEDNDGEENVSAELRENADKIIQTLDNFHVRVSISHVSRGPTVTRYELEPSAGTRVRSITNLLDDIALSLATSGVRSDGIITGKSAIGIEVPNKITNTVYVRELIEDKRFVDAKSRLTTCLGMDVSGAPVYLDVAKMPHLLIAGATGMGKSVCINSLLVSLLYKARPDEVKLILIDPKKVELNIYNGIPHLLVPVVFDPKKAAGSLHWAVTEMERRFELIEAQNTRNIAQYNAAIADDPKKEFLPQIVIIIDELADLMMSAPDDVEASICRLAQKARAAGMHLIIGTQRPSVDVITGLIKANIPSRIAFTVASQIDSRTIIDTQGAEKLIGRGDMLYAPVGASKPIRVQGSFVSEKEIEEIVGFIKDQSQGAAYSDEVIAQINRAAETCGQKKGKGGSAVTVSAGDTEESDPMLDSAIELAVESGKISTSLIQRRLQLGYGRAAKIIDMMERRGIVSAPDGQRPRTVLITREQYLEMQMRAQDETADGDEPF